MASQQCFPLGRLAQMWPKNASFFLSNKRSNGWLLCGPPYSVIHIVPMMTHFSKRGKADSELNQELRIHWNLWRTSCLSLVRALSLGVTTSWIMSAKWYGPQRRPHWAFCDCVQIRSVYVTVAQNTVLVVIYYSFINCYKQVTNYNNQFWHGLEMVYFTLSHQAQVQEN